jgi:hypothetical protein
LEAEGSEPGTILQKGIDKVEDYSGMTFETSAYLLAIGEWLSYIAV